MTYDRVAGAAFVDRPNRFVARVEIGGRLERCHVKNTGRCRELFLPGAAVYVQEAGAGPRKTRFDLIAAKKGERLVNVDSQAPNQVFLEWAQAGGFLPDISRIRPETRFLNSRFDFLIERGGREALVEVKGVTLEEDGVALFPDAPTQRGVKHLKELTEAVRRGFDAFAVFVVQMQGVSHFTPNAKTHPAFAEALREAARGGVNVLAVDCAVAPDSLRIRNPVEVRL